MAKLLNLFIETTLWQFYCGAKMAIVWLILAVFFVSPSILTIVSLLLSKLRDSYLCRLLHANRKRSDITAQKGTEEALGKKRRYLQSLGELLRPITRHNEGIGNVISSR